MRLPDAGECIRRRERVLEISPVCSRSRDPDLLREVGRGTVVRPLLAVCRLSNEADLSRECDDILLR